MLKPEKLEALTSALARQIKQSTTNDGTRAELFETFMAEPPRGKKRDPHRSNYTSSLARDAIEAIHTEVMSVLTEDDRLAEFAPVGPEDEEQAEQETDVVGHVVWQMNDGYNLFRAFTMEALVEQMAYMSAGWDEEEEVNIEVYHVADLDELTVILSGYEDEYEITEVDETEGGIKVEIRSSKKNMRYRIKHFPQSQMVVAGGWPCVSLRGCPMVGRIDPDWTKARAMAFGFSEDSLMKMQHAGDDEGRQSRDSTKFHDEEDRDTETLAIGEFYMRWSPDKGPERYWQVWASEDGKTVLEWEDGGPAVKEVPDHPFIAGTPKPLYHRHAGMSMTEYVEDLQRADTSLMRMTFDNITTTQYARPIVSMVNAPETMADLQNPAHGAPIRVSNPDALRWDRAPPIHDATLPIIGIVKDTAEARTGATRYNQGLDSNSLNRTASGIARIMNASQKRMLDVARAFKENTIRELYGKVHADLRRGPGKALTMRLRGKWVEVDPRAWKQRADIVVNGTSDRDLKQQGLQLAMQVQRELRASGDPELMRMVPPDKIYALASRMFAFHGYKSAATFLVDPATLPPLQMPPPPPNPMMIGAETDRMRAQTEAQEKAERLRIEQAKLQIEAVKLKLQDAKVTGDLENKAEEIDLKRDAAAAADDRAREQTAMTMVLAERDAERKRIEAETPNPEIANGQP